MNGQFSVSCVPNQRVALVSGDLNPMLPGTSDDLAPPGVLDGLTSSHALRSVMGRLATATLIYALTSSMFFAAFVAASHITLYGLSPIEFAVMNVISVVYFVGIMSPLALLLAWIYRYRRHLPYQHSSIELPMAYDQCIELALAAATSIRGAQLTQLDEHAGRISCIAPRQRLSGPQEVTIRVQELPNNSAQITVSSQPIVSPIEYLLFGCTLAVDGGRNKQNVDSVMSFLRKEYS